MSIALKNEVKELRGRIERLERICNKLNPEHRTVAGTPDQDSKPKRRNTNKKVEGNQ